MTQGSESWRRCDRCGIREKAPSDDNFGAWGYCIARRVHAGETDIIAGPDGEHQAADVCPPCFIQLMEWWKAGSGE